MSKLSYCDECGKLRTTTDEHVIRIPDTDAQFRISFEQRRMSGSGGCFGITKSKLCKKCIREEMQLLMVLLTQEANREQSSSV